MVIEFSKEHDIYVDSEGKDRHGECSLCFYTIHELIRYIEINDLQ
jgi:hypothetical protein